MDSENTPFELNDLNDPELEALAVALRENRPEPEAGFAGKLDTAVADHFPPEWSTDVITEPKAGFFERFTFRLGGPRKILLPATAGFAGLLVVAVVVGGNLNGPGETTDSSSSSSSDVPATSTESTPSPASPSADSISVIPNAGGEGAGRFLDKSPGAYAAGTKNRKVAMETDITLGTEPGNVQDASNEIVDVVDDHNGIVLDSSVKDGPAGEAGAHFSLLIPSAQLESAVSDLSGVADLRSRSQETEDITAPTLTVQDSLRDARARVDSLVKKLAGATTDEDRARIEDELAAGRRQASRLNTKLNRLERRASLTPVSVKVETGGDTSSSDDDSSWGISDAFDDAGRMLGVSAGVALIALAIAIPIGLIVLIALALNRAWILHSRRRALEEN